MSEINQGTIALLRDLLQKLENGQATVLSVAINNDIVDVPSDSPWVAALDAILKEEKCRDQY